MFVIISKYKRDESIKGSIKNTFDKVLDVIDMDESDENFLFMKKFFMKRIDHPTYGNVAYFNFDKVEENHINTIKSNLIKPSTDMYPQSKQILRQKRLDHLLSK